MKALLKMEYLEGHISGVKDKVEFTYLIKHTDKYFKIYIFSFSTIYIEMKTLCDNVKTSNI